MNSLRDPLPIKLIVRRKNLRFADLHIKVPSIFSIAGTKADFEYARYVVFIDDDDEQTETVLKRTGAFADEQPYLVIERPITSLSSVKEINDYLADLRSKMQGA